MWHPVKKLVANLLLIAGFAAAARTQSTMSDQPADFGATPSVGRASTSADASAEENHGFLSAGVDPENRLFGSFLKHAAADQAQFWSAGKELKNPDALKMFLPFVGFTGLLMAGDSWFARQIPDQPNQLTRSKNISNYGVFSLAGMATGSYLFGHTGHNEHLRETGLLSGEAALNSLLVVYALKEATQRQRPDVAGGHGNFLADGSSFPSEHSAVAWSVAAVVAHEYPGTWTQMAAYGLASAVSLTRITGRQHFPSDVFVGSALGWYFARQIYRSHHDPEVGGAPWGDLFEPVSDAPRSSANMSSPYVPLDSWVYAALERLAALGYVQSAYLGMRPWTRMACAQLIEEAGDQLHDAGADDKSAEHAIFESLAAEFRGEIDRRNGAANIGASLDAVYTRFTGISGVPVRDGYHFAQTLVNDYGRPYGAGFNNVSGATSRAVLGPFSLYVRGEYQHAPGSPSDPMSALQGIAEADLTTPLVSNPAPEVSRFHLLEATVAVTLHNTQVSLGKQSLWLGPGEAGPLLFSNNAEPIMMVRIDSIQPYRIPLLSNLLGPVRTEYFLGQLSGDQFEFNPVSGTLLGPGGIKPQPYLQGYKISFKPTPNLEAGMGITAEFAGPGLPFTWANFVRTLYSHTSSSSNPGKRLSAADLSYRIPGLRKWVSLYGDSLVVDEISPIGSSRATVNPGIYLPQIPHLAKLEFRAEYLRSAQTHDFAPGFVYYGVRRYRSGYTNQGNLLASWIGRAGTGGQGWLTYSFSPRSHFQVGYRHQEVNPDFIGGGQLNDFSARGDLRLASGLTVSGSVQYEQWRFPLLFASGQSDVTTSFQFTFDPRRRLQR